MIEIWKPIFNNQYYVSNIGRVKSIKGNKILKLQLREGYFRIGLHSNSVSKYFSVHRLVAQTFIPNPDNKPEVNHIDGDKKNNNTNNLEWVTSKENTRHAIDVLNFKPKLYKPKKVSVACINTGEKYESATVAARNFGLTASAILKCCNGKYKTSGGLKWEYA